MRAIADERLEPTKTFADEMYYCLGCLACMTACPAGVDYAELFERARAEAEASRVLATPGRSLIRTLSLRGLFMDLNRLKAEQKGLDEHWQKEKSAVGRIRELKKTREQLKLDEARARAATAFGPVLR